MNFTNTYFIKQGIIWLGLAIVPAALLIAGYTYWYSIPPVSTVSESNVEISDTDPSGTILLSLITSDGVPVPALLDVSSGEVFDLPVLTLEDSQAVSLQYRSSYDDSFMTFLGIVNETFDETLPDAMNIYRADTDGILDPQGFIDALETAQKVAQFDEKDYLRQMPSISTTGEILFSSLNDESYNTQTTFATLPANTWNVYLVDTDGRKILLTQGIYPQWLNTDMLVFLKDDGVYLYNVETNEEKLVWETSDKINMVNGFDVSDDGSYFSITYPEQNKVEIVKVLNWNEKVFSSPTELSLTATNPTFSHDNEFLALIISWQDENDSGKISTGIEYYSLINKQLLSDRITFDKETIDGIYVTDWRPSS